MGLKRLHFRYRLHFRSGLDGRPVSRPYDQIDYSNGDLNSMMRELCYHHFWSPHGEPRFAITAADGTAVAEFELDQPPVRIWDSLGVLTWSLRKAIHGILRDYERGIEPVGPVAVRWKDVLWD